MSLKSGDVLAAGTHELWYVADNSQGPQDVVSIRVPKQILLVVEENLE